MSLRIVLFCALFLSLPSWISFSFKIPPYIPFPSHPEWEVKATPEMIALLSQPFTYLNRGNQATVFLSEDGTTVLKLFRYTRPRFLWIQRAKEKIALWLGKKGKNDLLTKLHKTLEAAHIAYTEGQPFTQVLYCHLNLTKNQLPTVTLKAHRTYQLPLDGYRFILQKRVSSFKETLLEAKETPEKMHALIDSFLELIVARSKQGIRNSDPNLGPNFGFLDNRAVEMDFGNYRKVPFDPEKQAKEVTGYFTRLEDWLKKNSPEYIPYLQQKIAILYSRQNEEATSAH